ncbi:UV excision repair protein RAD23-like protein B [Paramicrosporidium saccamoebae]|uniref:UV excision repair protein RAD23 n=1 Tax=Paramicrosporidium saccamoebae TaxID=1246581 RepID=A0A2H9TLS4_9FUNG|nr:UV excision repair protein RAD23-like protein B [Paramicrosporidium saccamoebae]
MGESKNTPVERQKLIHAGKVLENEQVISQTALKEGDFVVLMTVTPKPVSAGTTTRATSATPATPVVQSATGDAESKLVTGEAYEDAVGKLVDMGFGKEEVMAAMRASFNNPERAVEYLTTGMLPAEEDEAPMAHHESSGSLDFLRNDPQFQQLRSLIQQNPQMLGPIIEQLSQNSPEILQLIEQNREEFYALIMEGANPDGEGEGEGEGEESNEEEDDGGDGDDGELPPGAQVLQVSEEDRQAIERLESMGFGRAHVVEAFFACDKNEELAANYLLEHLNDQDL